MICITGAPYRDLPLYFKKKVNEFGMGETEKQLKVTLFNSISFDILTKLFPHL